ncbi:hypothetical protein RKE29_12920 [Streptomyces sp. B1866]|uniref:hypothetical protein n=1 Tax=Streptomyces sp. B1866 TaxID=3075431 RepID=UPI00288E5F75|nr:hypothetical protein [Streptomyces sp. B1866]MDT3397543.1 hypothetical protein [Streptomyces sp. B1866]
MLFSLVATVPEAGTGANEWASFLLRKAEIMDVVGMVCPEMWVHAGELASRARYEAATLTSGHERDQRSPF